MSEKTADDAAGYEVVFGAFWCDTTRHGIMKDYHASPEPVMLPKLAADAAVASGAAKPYIPDMAGGNGAADMDAE